MPVPVGINHIKRGHSASPVVINGHRPRIDKRQDFPLSIRRANDTGSDVPRLACLGAADNATQRRGAKAAGIPHGSGQRLGHIHRCVESVVHASQVSRRKTTILQGQQQPGAQQFGVAFLQPGSNRSWNKYRARLFFGNLTTD